MLDWLWGSKKESNNTPKEPENKEDLDFLDPKLKEFYNESKPVTPISLAPKEIQDQYAKEQNEYEESRKSNADYRNKERGLHQIEEKVHVKGVPLAQAARNNCVEYEVLMANCALKGTYWERLNLCHMYRKQQMRCVELQEDALKKLGYNLASTDEQVEIQGKCDDLFSAIVPNGAITDEIASKFDNAIEKERQKSEIYRAS